MNLIKRLTTSVSATLENAVGELENHDAIVEANVKQTRQSVAKAQARLTALQQQQVTFESQLKSATEQISVWEERATLLANDNKHKALQCLTRRNQCEADAHRLAQTIQQQERLISTVSSNLIRLKAQLDDITQRHNLMRSRQTVADVNRAVARAEQSHEMNETFERWEAIVVETELAGDVGNHDPLNEAFAQEEHDVRLQVQLADLLKNHPDQTKPSQ